MPDHHDAYVRQLAQDRFAFGLFQMPQHDHHVGPLFRFRDDRPQRFYVRCGVVGAQPLQSGVSRERFEQRADHRDPHAPGLANHVRRIHQPVSGRVHGVRADGGEIRDLQEIADSLPAVVEFVVAQTVDVDAQVVGDLVIGQASEQGADRRALHQIARVQDESRVGRGALPIEQCRQVRHASDAIGIGKQAVVQIVEVQNGELVDGALPASGEQPGPQE